MEKITLNNTPVRTSNNYGINDITLEFETPIIKNFENFTIISSEQDKFSVEKINNDKLDSRIGLNLQQNFGIKISVNKNTYIKEPIIIEYYFDEDNNNLVDNIKIDYGENSDAVFIIKYLTDSEEKQFHYLKNEVHMEKNSKGKVIIANILSEKSQNFIAYENKLDENSNLTSINIDLGGEYKISNYYTQLYGDKSVNNVKNIYIGTKNDLIDINYNIDTIGKTTKSTILSEGAIDDCAKKHFKGTIDFKEGSRKSKGIENENCLILSDKAESKSLPMLLCHEEDVYGEHGVSSGKPSESTLFYIMTRGISYSEARKLMVKANLNKIIKEIKNEELEEEITKIIDKKLYKE